MIGLGFTPALSAIPDGSTYSVTPETIRARVAVAHRVLELAQSVQTAETVRDVVAVALADAASAGQDLTTILPEYRRADTALTDARAAYAQAEDQLADVRVLVRLSA